MLRSLGFMKISELFSDPKAWTKGALARTAGGTGVGAMESKAVCWCLMGAIGKCYTHTERREILLKIQDRIAPSNISEFNDFQGYQAVVDLVKELDI